jgi:hypothetical protein
MIYYNFNLSGEGVQISALEQSEREIFVYRRIEKRARNIAKYYARKHGMDEEECTMFATSSMFNKLLDLRSKEIKRYGVHYNAVEYVCMIKMFSQLKHAYQRANFTQAGNYDYHSACFIPNTEINLHAPEGVKHFEIKGRYINESVTLENRTDNRTIGKCFDYVDILEMWDNRHARHEYKLSRALENMNSLTSVYEYTSDKHYLSMTTEERERAKKAINKQLHADALKYNDIRNMVKLSGNYGTPEADLLNKCALVRARKLITRIYNETQSGARVIDIISSHKVQTPAERRAICDFRKRHSDMFDKLDYLQEKLEIEM